MRSRRCNPAFFKKEPFWQDLATAPPPPFSQRYIEGGEDGKAANGAGEPEDLPIKGIASWIGPSKY